MRDPSQAGQKYTYAEVALCSGVQLFSPQLIPPPLQAPVCHVLPPVLQGRSHRDIHVLWLVQRLLHHQLRVRGALPLSGLLDGEEHLRPAAGGPALVELRRRRRQVPLGVRVEKRESLPRTNELT